MADRNKFYVDLLFTTENGQEPAGRIEMEEGGDVSFVGVDKGMVREWQEMGVGKPGTTRMYPKDGLDFLKALAPAISGSYLRATKVMVQ